MRKILRLTSCFLLASAMFLGACSQRGCPTADTNGGKKGPGGKGGEADQKLFEKDMR